MPLHGKGTPRGLPHRFDVSIREYLLFNLDLLFNDHLTLVRSALWTNPVRKDVRAAPRTRPQVWCAQRIVRSSHARFGFRFSSFR